MPIDTCDMVRSSANRGMSDSSVITSLKLIIVTANSNKWQQALRFVSCAQVSRKVVNTETLHFQEEKKKIKPLCINLETEYKHIMV